MTQCYILDMRLGKNEADRHVDKIDTKQLSGHHGGLDQDLQMTEINRWQRNSSASE